MVKPPKRSKMDAKKRVACASYQSSSQRPQLGIDLVCTDSLNYKMLWEALSEEEQKIVNDDQSFGRIWAIKEAYLKAIGVGLAMELNQISVSFIPSDSCLNDLLIQWEHSANTNALIKQVPCTIQIAVQNERLYGWLLSLWEVDMQHVLGIALKIN